MPSRNEIREYKLLTDEAVRAHRLMMQRGKLPRPGGAFDVIPEWMKVYSRASPAKRLAIKRQVLRAFDAAERPPHYTAEKNDPARDDEPVPGGFRIEGARDQEGEHDHKKVAALMQFLTDKLNDEDDVERVMALLDDAFPNCLGNLDGQGALDDDITEVPPFPGRPSVGGAPLPLGKSLGQDAAMRRSIDARMKAADASDYNRRFPDAARIVPDNTPGAR